MFDEIGAGYKTNLITKLVEPQKLYTKTDTSL
jgi:hypothetical protein